MSLPSRANTQITEGGALISKNRAIKLAGKNCGRAILEIGSGSYEFQTVY